MIETAGKIPYVYIGNTCLNDWLKIIKVILKEYECIVYGVKKEEWNTNFVCIKKFRYSYNCYPIRIEMKEAIIDD